ncbi:hypothetical protein RFI_33283, partial [Reticulomyxa filosa]
GGEGTKESNVSETLPTNKKKDTSPTKGQSESGNTKTAPKRVEKETKNTEKEAKKQETSSTPEGELVNDLLTSPASQQKSNGEIQQRLWEKEQLQEINLRVGNILNVFSFKADKTEKPGVDTEALNKLQEQHLKALKDLSDNFLLKEQKKAADL